MYKERVKLIFHSLEIALSIAAMLGQRIEYANIPDYIAVGGKKYRKTSIKRYIENIVLYCREIGIECPVKKEYGRYGRLIIVIDTDKAKKLYDELGKSIHKVKTEKRQAKKSRKSDEMIKKLEMENRKLRNRIRELEELIEKMKKQNEKEMKKKKCEDVYSLQKEIAVLRRRLDTVNRSRDNLVAKIEKCVKALREYRRILKYISEMTPQRMIKSAEKYAIEGEFDIPDVIAALMLDASVTTYRNKSPGDWYVENWNEGVITEKDIEHARNILRDEAEKIRKLIEEVRPR